MLVHGRIGIPKRNIVSIEKESIGDDYSVIIRYLVGEHIERSTVKYDCELVQDEEFCKLVQQYSRQFPGGIVYT